MTIGAHEPTAAQALGTRLAGRLDRLRTSSPSHHYPLDLTTIFTRPYADQPAIVVQSDLTVVAEVKVDFDADFGSKYNITKGVLTNDAEHEVFAPVALFLEALDLALDRLRETSPDSVARIKGISGSCQQHGSTYWSAEAEALLANLDPAKALVDQLADAFSHPYAPNWQDGSTQAQCDRFDEHLGDAQRLAHVTGSAAHHRFTGTQIMRLREKRPAMYAATARISLISSFLASLLLGRIAPFDISDITGMNLWDIPSAAWSDELPRRIYLVGGGSLNPAIGQVLGEVLGGAEGVYRLDVGGNACALGGAYKAVWARERKEGETFDELIGARWKEDEAVERVDIGYRKGIFERYGEVVDSFEEMEKRILQVAKN
ncbi:xylulose kinase [Verticillium alfalfae VaMs.102]|uniref:Xylulose kinase n=1 Tax=Verticillium alfalfae (strain VaMs.102 / ATCC MYA-4576 / FGSC 10136) TaxID=526221 RepID=C9SPC5_VERA1|nr:xylulose kinase [Verticillium alfalfae VaMs.102]EEY20640.1 xylulose kinase [Verticillium alfalfae VaMs.102]